MQPEWINRELGLGTQRLREPSTRLRAMQRVLWFLERLQKGSEQFHLEDLLRFVDHRGAGVRLEMRNEDFCS